MVPAVKAVNLGIKASTDNHLGQDGVNYKKVQLFGGLFHQWGNNFDLIKFIFASRYFIAVSRHPKPYFKLR